MKSIYKLLFMFLISGTISAQAPELMSYQAIVRGSDDTLIQNGNIGIRISILQGSESGTAVYTETHSTTTNDNGLVTLEIGSGATSDDFSAIDWSTGSYFIKSETDPNGGSNYTIEGTSRLLSVPYALFANSVGDSPTFVPEEGAGSGNIGAYSTSSAYAYDADTSTWFSQSLSGSSQMIIKSNGNIAAASSSSLYAWNDEDNTWYSQSISGSFNDLKGANGNFGGLSSSSAYAWNEDNSTWYSQSISGSAVSIVVTPNGNIGVLSTSSAYAWNRDTNTWYSQSISGSAVSIVVTPNGNIGVLSSSSTYAWNQETNSWTSQSISGSAQGIIGTTEN